MKKILALSFLLITAAATFAQSPTPTATPFVNQTQHFRGGYYDEINGFTMVSGGYFAISDGHGHLMQLQGIETTSNADHTLNIKLSNADRDLRLGGNFTVSGGDTTLTVTGTTNVTLPLTGTVVTAENLPVEIGVAISDETTAITTGTAKVTFRAPYAFTVTSVRASLTTASASGTPTFNVKESGTTIFSTLLTIDATETTSTTAAVPAVISDSAIANDAQITIDVTDVGSGECAGGKIWLIGHK